MSDWRKGALRDVEAMRDVLREYDEAKAGDAYKDAEDLWRDFINRVELHTESLRAVTDAYERVIEKARELGS